MSERIGVNGLKGKLSGFAHAGLATLAIISCAPSPTEAEEKFRPEDYRYKITVETGSTFVGSPISLIFYTNDQPVIDSKEGKSHLNATNVICPKSQQFDSDGIRKLAEQFGCTNGPVNLEISTSRQVAVVTQNQR